MFDYDAVAKRYDRHRKGGGPFMSSLQALADAAGAEQVLELGTGTGNNACAFLNARPVRCIVGLDQSMGMLVRAAKKGLLAHWIRGNAVALPFVNRSFDFVFSVLMLHHIRDIMPVMQECYRVARTGGYTAFITASHDFIDRHPMNRYFPSFAAIDKERFQDVPQIEEALRNAGFGETGQIHAKRDPEPIDEHYLDKVAHRFISTFDLIPDHEFYAGLNRLRHDISVDGCAGTMQWESVTIWGRK